MAEAVIEAREKDIDVLVGGGDSNSNALDKFFADGTMDMLPIFDFLPFTIKVWRHQYYIPSGISEKITRDV